jgi:predicted nucleotidyltransferase
VTALYDDVAEVARLLDSRGISHALIGAAALAGLGIVRGSADVDLLVTDGAVLAEAFWAPLAANGIAVDIRRGDDTDPLAGVVRLSAAGRMPVDVVVGKRAWQRDAVARARPIELGGVGVRLVQAADLVLLKLYAGGPQDAADVRLILLAGDRDAIRVEVDARVTALPPESVALWRSIVAEG